mmetsp:Transcript_87169/g.281546  ORF Transcript_87169/g.281546 Transcript_87169/m.281546 type:complete len:120 (-) Transcript_87169:43-402(-)
MPVERAARAPPAAATPPRISQQHVAAAAATGAAAAHGAPTAGIHAPVGPAPLLGGAKGLEPNAGPKPDADIIVQDGDDPDLRNLELENIQISSKPCRLAETGVDGSLLAAFSDKPARMR